MPQYELAVHPQADTEFERFVNADRSTAFDVGNHFGALESAVNNGLAKDARPAYMEEGCDLYMFYGSELQMFIAVRDQTMVLIHLSALGSEHEEAEALGRAVTRMREWFKL